MSRVDDPAVRLAHESALRSIARVVKEQVAPTDPEVALRAVREQVERGGVLVLTGAGVSTDSGIPDYRGERGSLKRHRPMTYQEFCHDPEALHRYWARSFVGWRVMDQARPNFVHRAIAQLEAEGRVSGVVTQNVDKLHHAAGSRNVVAIHGDLATVICLDCGAREDRRHFDDRLAQINERYEVDASEVNPDGDVALAPELIARFRLAGCQRCGSTRLKPDVVYFGEPVPAERKQQVANMLEESQSLLVAGSSLAVMSGLKVLIDAKKQGKMVSVINGGPGRGDNRADIVWRTQLAPAFAQIVKERT